MLRPPVTAMAHRVIAFDNLFALSNQMHYCKIYDQQIQIFTYSAHSSGQRGRVSCSSGVACSTRSPLHTLPSCPGAPRKYWLMDTPVAHTAAGASTTSVVRAASLQEHDCHRARPRDGTIPHLHIPSLCSYARQMGDAVLSAPPGCEVLSGYLAVWERISRSTSRCGGSMVFATACA